MKPHYVPEPIHYHGALVGYRLFTREGIFGALVFARYHWLGGK